MVFDNETRFLTDVWLQLGQSDNILRIDRNKFKEWLGKEGLQYVSVRNNLVRHFGAANVTERRAALGSGCKPGANLAGLLSKLQTNVIDIQLPAPLTPSGVLGSASPGSP